MTAPTTRYCIVKPIWQPLAGWVVFLALATSLSAQPTDLYFHHLTPAQGLSQTTSRCIYRDSSGFVWIGTSEGLNRFDGVRVKVYQANPGDSTQLADPTVVSPIFEDRYGDLWFSTLTALHRYRRATDDFERFYLHNDQNIKGYQVFHLDSHDSLWVHCNGRLYLFDIRPAVAGATRFHELYQLDHAPLRYFEQEAATDGGTLYAPLHPGLVRYTYKAGRLVPRDTLFTGRPGQPAAQVTDVFQEKDGTVWISCMTGLFQVKPGAVPLLVPLSAGQALGNIQHLQPWGEQYLFVTTDHGLGLLDKPALAFVRHWQSDERNPAALSTNRLSAVHLDRDQNLWISAWTKGVDYTNLQKLKFETRRYYQKDQSGKSSLFVPGPMLEDARNRIWCGSQMHGLLALQSDTGQYDDFSALAPGPDQLFDLPNGHILINNFYQGLSLLDPVKRIARPLLWQQKAVNSYHLCQVMPGTFLLAGTGPGLRKLTIEGDRYTFDQDQAEAVAGKDWLYIARRSDHEFILADGNYAIYLYRDRPVASIEQFTVLPGYINCSLENESGEVWLGGSFGLLQIRQSAQQCRYITTADGLPDNMVYAMLRVSPEEWWLSTGKGLVRFNPLTMQFQKFTLADGLQAFEYNRRSCLRTADGVLWFGGVGGYNRFHPSAVRPLDILPKIQLINIQINEGDYPYADNPTQLRSLRLPYDSATLTFHFAALEFSDPLNNRLKYRLDFADGAPFDQDWVHCPDARGFARYANLPPGRYKLLIMAANSDGVWNPVPKELAIEITPPYYQTWWFRCLLVLAGALSIYTIYRSRLIAMRRQEEHKRKVIELELNALRAQLNPHFISNNLISINSYIRNNGVEKVRGYVATFAKLMRNVLESARNPVVPLTEELEMLRNFVAVESGRFPQPIDFDIRLAAGINTDQLFLPGMLLQPFVENAIVHGIAPRNGQGKIRVHVAKESNALVFVIEDDGVGRSRTASAASAPERKSHGLDITRERLHLYDLQHQTRSHLRVDDLKKEDGTVAGTRVMLHLGLPKPGR